MRTLKKLLLAVLALAIVVGGGVTWRVLASRAGQPLAHGGAGEGGKSPNVVLPGDYQPTQDEQAWIAGHTGRAGAFVKKFGDYRLVLVTMGEKPTGGYAVEIKEVATTGGNWVVDVKFVSPGPGDIVTQVLTYPYQFLKIKDDAFGIRVRDVTGSEPAELTVTIE